MPTATAASSADSSATRLRNFSARSSVWRISGRPVASDSMRMPRRLLALISASAQSTNSATLASRAASAATARRYEMRLAGWTRPVAARSASFSMHARREAGEAGAAVGLDDDDAGDLQARVAEQERVADGEAERVEQRGVDPRRALGRRRGDVDVLRARRVANAQPAAQRVGVADRLDADQPRRAALLVGSAAHAREVRRRRGREAERARLAP